MDVSQYLEIFIEETKEHLQTLNEQLLILEKEPENSNTINEIFRAAHSLKGMAGTMGYKKMQRLTHEMENVFSEIRNEKVKVNADLIDILFRGLDAISNFLDNIIATADEGEGEGEDLPSLLSKYLNDNSSDTKQEPAAKETKTAATATAVAAADSTKEKFRLMKVADHEKKAIDKAVEAGKNVYGVTVFIRESCILKSARAFLVFKALEEHGDVIKASPEVQDIEDENFDFDFSILYISDEEQENVKKIVMNISEIDDVSIGIFESSDKDDNEKDTEEKPVKTTVADTSVKASQAVKEAPQKGKKTQTAAAAASTAKPIVNRSVRIDIEKLDNLMNSVSELIIAKNGLVSLSSTESGRANQGSFNEQIEYLERITTELHQSVMKVRMVPIETVFNKFPRMIRDLSKKLGKDMELIMSGEDTELDRTVVDEIGDPLQHLLRNSADHGLEKNDIRVAAGKPEVGSIYLNAFQEGNNVVIEVKDDGAGINIEKIKQKGIEKGLVSDEQAETLTDKEVIDLMFKPGFSTADVVSDVSGRGVGLDVVKTKIEALGGDVEAKTVQGHGSSFTIRLPLTLAIIQALMVELGSEKYAIPLGSIQTIEDVPYSDIKYVQTKPVISIRGTVIPLISLDDILQVPKEDTKPETLTVVIVRKGEKQAGLIVDNLIGQLEIVIKSIGKYINNSKLISGATILGDGEIALILDANALL